MQRMQRTMARSLRSPLHQDDTRVVAGVPFADSLHGLMQRTCNESRSDEAVIRGATLVGHFTHARMLLTLGACSQQGCWAQAF